MVWNILGTLGSKQKLPTFYLLLPTCLQRRQRGDQELGQEIDA